MMAFSVSQSELLDTKQDTWEIFSSFIDPESGAAK